MSAAETSYNFKLYRNGITIIDVSLYSVNEVRESSL